MYMIGVLFVVYPVSGGCVTGLPLGGDGREWEVQVFIDKIKKIVDNRKVH